MEILRLAAREAPLDCVASIVLYKNPPEMIETVISSFLETKLKVKLYIVDNSPEPLPLPLNGRPAFYHFAGQNLGYGKAHNWCLQRCEPSRYFLILNPDVIISPGVIEELGRYLDANPAVGMVCPKVLNKDHTLQYLNKRHPNLTDLFLRRFFYRYGERFAALKGRLDRYEMRDVGYHAIHEVPFMTGAFMFCRTDVLKRVGGFDRRFFMYFEDADLSRKFQQEGFKTVYYPYVNITHLWQREAQKRLTMALVFMISGIKYFHKWGWKLA